MEELLFFFFQYRVSMLFLIIFQLLFLTLHYKKWRSIAIGAGCFILTGFMDYILFFVRFRMENQLLSTMVQIVVVQATAYFLCRYRDFRALFTGLTSSIYVLPGNIISVIIYIGTGKVYIALTVQAIVHLILLGILVVVLRENYLSEMEEESKSWWKLCVIPVLCYMVTYTLACWPGNLYERRENCVTALLLLMLIGITYVLMFKLLAKQRMERELELGREFLETYAWGLSREADVLKKAEEKIKVLRHDSRHVYQLIAVYLETGETEQIKKLLSQIEMEFQTVTPKRFCENVTINGILSGCEVKAQKEKIQFLCEIDVPGVLKNINEFELATVVSNLLENALLAAAKVAKPAGRRVIVRMFPVKGQLILEIMNTFIGNCEFSRVTGLPLSTKGDGHGYGLRSVKAYANKNNAIFRYSIEEGMFCVRLLTNI